MLPPEHIVDQMPDPNRKRRTRLDEMTQDVEDTKPPDKMFDMPKNIQVNGTAELSPKSNASKFLKYFVYLLKIVTCEENIYFLVMKRFLNGLFQNEKHCMGLLLTISYFCFD
jgi:hypothetical protein